MLAHRTALTRAGHSDALVGRILRAMTRTILPTSAGRDDGYLREEPTSRRTVPNTPSAANSANIARSVP